MTVASGARSVLTFRMFSTADSMIVPSVYDLPKPCTAKRLIVLHPLIEPNLQRAALDDRVLVRRFVGAE